MHRARPHEEFWYLAGVGAARRGDGIGYSPATPPARAGARSGVPREQQAGEHPALRALRFRAQGAAADAERPRAVAHVAPRMTGRPRPRRRTTPRAGRCHGRSAVRAGETRRGCAGGSARRQRVPCPARSATSSTARSVASRRCWACRTRCWISQAPGDCPVSSRNRRAKVRRLIPARRARAGTSARQVLHAQARCRRRRLVGAAGDVALDVLRLPAVAPRRDDAVARHVVGDLGCRGRGGSGAGRGRRRRSGRRCQHVAVVGEEHVGVEEDVRVERGQLVGVLPVGRGRRPSRTPGRREHEGAGADRDQPRAAAVPSRGPRATSRGSVPSCRGPGSCVPGTITVSARASAEASCCGVIA